MCCHLILTYNNNFIMDGSFMVLCVCPWSIMIKPCRHFIFWLGSSKLREGGFYRKLSIKGTSPYKGAPLFFDIKSLGSWTFLGISQPKMVRFSFCKKPLEGWNVFYSIRAAPKGVVIIYGRGGGRIPNIARTQNVPPLNNRELRFPPLWTCALKSCPPPLVTIHTYVC